MEAKGDPDELKNIVTKEEMERVAAEHHFSAALECSAKLDGKSLKKVSHTGMKGVF